MIYWTSMENQELQNQIIHLGEDNKRLREELSELRGYLETIKQHRHSGINFPQVSGSDLLGFRVVTVADASVDPTLGASAGILVIQKDSSHTYLHVNIGGSWKAVELT